MGYSYQRKTGDFVTQAFEKAFTSSSLLPKEVKNKRGYKTAIQSREGKPRGTKQASKGKRDVLTAYSLLSKRGKSEKTEKDIESPTSEGSEKEMYQPLRD